jgi:hypothetical protein
MLIAATLKKYWVPFVRLVAVQDGVVEFVGHPVALAYTPFALVATCTR